MALDKSRPGLFFLVGPLRTGSSLLTRCIDDHPRAMCLCESEINRALFKAYYVALHYWRMRRHGLTAEEICLFLDQLEQDDVASLMRWFPRVAPRMSALYDKPNPLMFGDKSPDYFRSPDIVGHLAARYPLIYTVRDPRAILASIERQADASADEKKLRWEWLSQNYTVWKPYLEAPNLLVVNYEHLIATPETTMESVYAHLGLAYSWRFLSNYRRPHPGRFLWTTSVDLETGVVKDLDPGRLSSWKTSLTDEQLDRVYSNATVVDFMKRFGYEI